MSGVAKPGLLIIYDYFFPAYKAGGPVQSLANMVILLQAEYRITVITGADDLHAGRLAGIQPDIWTSIMLPGAQTPVDIIYVGNKNMGPIIKKAIAAFNPAVVYLNGIFSFRFFFIPLIAVKHTKLVVCPRGMLQIGALAGKSVKKKIYLKILNIYGLVKNVTWHATNEAEKADVQRVFGNGAKIIIAPNIPRKPVQVFSYPAKIEGRLNLVYLSLISVKKNLLQLIEIVSGAHAGITLDIYGPVKDEGYWKKCQETIGKNTGKIKYHGDVVPGLVLQVFSKYDASILLTKGENFGHALYESLSAGRPVITSYFTPWNDLEAKKAGWNVDISLELSTINLINAIAAMDIEAFHAYCKGAYALADEYYNSAYDKTSYKELFSIS
jgi:hypothetical protein